MAKHRQITKPWFTTVLDAGVLARREARHALSRTMETPRLTIGALAVAVASVSSPGIAAVSGSPVAAESTNLAESQSEQARAAAAGRAAGQPGAGDTGDRPASADKGGPPPAPVQAPAQAPAPEVRAESEAAPPPAPRPARKTGTDAWIDQATEILVANGTPREKINPEDIRTIIKHESGGDPKAINLWDSNARKGTPSKGLMQCIDPTFRTHALPGHNDIYDPVDNIIAGVRYSVSRYGSTSNVPGIKSKKNGRAYRGY